jgi:hypothetical protein
MEGASRATHAEELTATRKTEYKVLRDRRVVELRVAFQPVQSAFSEL